MKTSLKNLLLLPTLMVSLGLIPAVRVSAQTFTTLYSFTDFGDVSSYINSDGVTPYAGLILSDNTLYGTAHYGGSSGYGTVFRVNIDGTGFTNLHSFTKHSSSSPHTNSDGSLPYAALVLSGNILYGTAEQGGTSGGGVVFALNTDGTGFTNLHNFTGFSDGFYPYAGLLLSGSTLYGTARQGGSSFKGTVFSLNTNGTAFTNLHSFAGSSDGAEPYAGLLLSGSTLYGTAWNGGSLGDGTVFAVNTNGTGFTNLHNFSYNNDGAGPIAGLILSSNTLYGATYYGGGQGNGTVFALNTDGTSFTNLHSFAATSDGAQLEGRLILSGNTLYGTATGGGKAGSGTIFAVNTDGTGFTTLYSFTTYPSGSFTNSDGTTPYAGLILSGNTMYGTAAGGGTGGSGTLFSLSFEPQLTMMHSGADFILTWPTNLAGFSYAGFALQSTTNLASSAVWITNSPAPTVVNGQNTVTNSMSGTQKFFRLSQ